MARTGRGRQMVPATLRTSSAYARVSDRKFDDALLGTRASALGGVLGGVLVSAVLFRVQPRIHTAPLDQFGVGSLLNDCSSINNEDHVSRSHGR